MATPYRLGENAVLYFSATPVSALNSAPATIAANVKGVKTGGKSDQPEYTTRANNGFKQFASSLKDLDVSFEIKVPGEGVDDPAYDAFLNAWISSSEIAAWALSDTAANNGDGPAGNFTVGSFSVDQSNGTVQFASVELKPSSYNSWFHNDGSSSASSDEMHFHVAPKAPVAPKVEPVKPEAK